MITFSHKSDLLLPSFQLKPHGSREILVPLVDSINIDYLTHQGLISEQKVNLYNLEKPLITSLYWYELSSSQNEIKGYSLGEEFQAIIPSDWKVTIDDVPEIIQNNYIHKTDVITSHKPSNIQVSFDNVNWVPWTKDIALLDNIFVKYRFNRPIRGGDILLVDGVATNEFGFRVDTQKEFKKLTAHSYRENIIYLDDYVPVGYTGNFYLSLGTRQQRNYIDTSEATVNVQPSVPTLFSPQNIHIYKKQK